MEDKLKFEAKSLSVEQTTLETNQRQIQLQEQSLPQLRNSFPTYVYVDDIGGYRENEDKTKQITSVIDAILRNGQFQIKKWHSSNKKVDQTDQEHVDFLRKKWNKVRDTIRKTEIVAEEKPVTKRNCLAYLAQLWDPTILVTPTTIEMRIDLQELWSFMLFLG